MTLTLHRVSKLQYATQPLLTDHGFGAAKFGGRWNSADPALEFDRRIIYASDTLGQALLEVIVQVGSGALHRVPHGHVTLAVDPDAIAELPASALPPNWNDPPLSPATQIIGDEWYDLGSSPVLRVPSVILPLTVYGPGQANYLINAGHPNIRTAVQLVILSFYSKRPSSAAPSCVPVFAA
ncbi:RES family NAD+ phosphorylase [Deinococcus multiflagellatus]|uniref:RES family NAD+ phosphorylase n=1 Tax=Deinococcus multiflagellatus TaxID=1656887 RepID=A0ABW1ZP87_9DEIO|nr:RES family NAD+ phosphorylase [Deinococcus multiflagellatus]MBZ9715710.1 RES family NAD+ phosphorylase [Deinococcus multiflagellatus]